jgi:hypothetical protein
MIDPSGARTVSGVYVAEKGITSKQFIQEITEDIDFDDFTSVYPNAFKYQKETLEQISAATDPPSDVLKRVTVPSLDVPLVKFNKKLILAILDSLDTLESAVQEKDANVETLSNMSSEIARLRKQITKLSPVESSFNASKISYDEHFAPETIGDILPLVHHHIYGEAPDTILGRYHDTRLECY